MLLAGLYWTVAGWLHSGHDGQAIAVIAVVWAMFAMMLALFAILAGYSRLWLWTGATLLMVAAMRLTPLAPY